MVKQARGVQPSAMQQMVVRQETISPVVKQARRAQPNTVKQMAAKMAELERHENKQKCTRSSTHGHTPTNLWRSVACHLALNKYLK